jgi:hypothetical protein
LFPSTYLEVKIVLAIPIRGAVLSAVSEGVCVLLRERLNGPKEDNQAPEGEISPNVFKRVHYPFLT